MKKPLISHEAQIAAKFEQHYRKEAAANNDQGLGYGETADFFQSVAGNPKEAGALADLVSKLLKSWDCRDKLVDKIAAAKPSNLNKLPKGYPLDAAIYGVIKPAWLADHSKGQPVTMEKIRQCLTDDPSRVSAENWLFYTIIENAMDKDPAIKRDLIKFGEASVEEEKSIRQFFRMVKDRYDTTSSSLHDEVVSAMGDAEEAFRKLAKGKARS